MAHSRQPELPGSRAWAAALLSRASASCPRPGEVWFAAPISLRAEVAAFASGNGLAPGPIRTSSILVSFARRSLASEAFRRRRGCDRASTLLPPARLLAPPTDSLRPVQEQAARAPRSGRRLDARKAALGCAGSLVRRNNVQLRLSFESHRLPPLLAVSNALTPTSVPPVFE